MIFTSSVHFLGVFLLILILYGIGGLLFIYATGYLSSSKEGSYTLLFIFNIACKNRIDLFGFLLCQSSNHYCFAGGILVSGFYGVEKIPMDDIPLLYLLLFYLVKSLILVVPSLNFSLLFIKLMAIFQANSACDNCSDTIKAACEGELVFLTSRSVRFQCELMMIFLRQLRIRKNRTWCSPRKEIQMVYY